MVQNMVLWSVGFIDIMMMFNDSVMSETPWYNQEEIEDVIDAQFKHTGWWRTPPWKIILQETIDRTLVTELHQTITDLWSKKLWVAQTQVSQT